MVLKLMGVRVPLRVREGPLGGTLDLFKIYIKISIC